MSTSTKDRIRLFSVAAVAECLDVSVRTVRRFIKSGELAVHKFRGAVRISESDLRKFLETHRSGGWGTGKNADDEDSSESVEG